MPFLSRPRLAAFTVTAAALCACSPTFNWRVVPIADEGLVALLPCKADHATRTLPLGADAVAVRMAGCKAGGATFAVAHAEAGNAAQAETWMRAWRAATRTQLADATITEAATVLPRAAVSPAPVRLDTQDAGADTRTAPTHVLWFAQQRAGTVSLYQATVLGQPASPEAVSTFFEGLRLP